MTNNQPGCPLCRRTDHNVIWQDTLCRIERVTGEEGARFAGYCLVVWHAHVAEMTELSASERRHLMQVVFAVEAALRALLRPDKINLASLGNLVPHLHWHVIPRWQDDGHFPASIWTPAQALGTQRTGPETAVLRASIEQVLAEEGAGA